MHGRRSREHERGVQDRRMEAESMSLPALRKLLSGLLTEEMDIWRRSQQWVEENVHLDQADVCSIMASHYLQWSARKARALHDELLALDQ